MRIATPRSPKPLPRREHQSDVERIYHVDACGPRALAAIFSIAAVRDSHPSDVPSVLQLVSSVLMFFLQLYLLPSDNLT